MTRHGFDFMLKPVPIGSRVFNGLPVPVTTCHKMVIQSNEQVYFMRTKILKVESIGKVRIMLCVIAPPH